MGVLPERARASLRFSLDTAATDADVDFAIDLVPAAIAHLRQLSPTYNRATKQEPAASGIAQ
jgi:cysteine desulfurase